MGHVVRNQHHGQAFVAHAANQLKHHIAFFHAQRCRGFIHDDHVLRKRGGAGDSHALTLTARQGFYRLGHRANAHLEVVHALNAFLQHSLFVQHAQHVACKAGTANFAA